MKKIKLVIPMSGLGSRFLKAGYTAPKPLIEVHGKPMIEWVLKMFPSAADPLFICRREHIEKTPLQSILQALRPEGKIAVIEGDKQGPVAALLNAEEHIPDDQPILVSYCDYYMHWDYSAYEAMLSSAQLDGSIPCYTGFHPHLLHRKNLYASCRTDKDGWLQEIREKYSFAADKMQALHSPGVYYCGSGKMLKTYSSKLIAAQDSLNGEFYVSLIYNHMLKDGLKVHVPVNVKHFCQWGTPEDLEEYLYWTSKVRAFRA